MTELIAIGTQVVTEGDASARPGGIPWQFGEATPVAIPGEEGTLLAVVPLPGSGTSLAIVGYAVPSAGVPAAVAPAAGKRPDGGPEAANGLYLNHEQRRVWVSGTEVTLTFQEFELLAFLVTRPARVFSRIELLEEVWQRDLGATSRTVDVHVSRLRQKLGPLYGRCLVTEYRVGYQFRPPDKPPENR